MEIVPHNREIPIHSLTITLQFGESLHVLQPQLITAFQGSSPQRVDRYTHMKLIGLKPKKMIFSKIFGPASFLLTMPEGYEVKILNLEAKHLDWLFDPRHILFHSDGLHMTNVQQRVKNNIFSKRMFRTRFEGKGWIGVISKGPAVEQALDQTTPLYVDIKCLIAYPSQTDMNLSVYGNNLANRYMNLHWRLLGGGTVLIQSTKADLRL